VKYDEPLVDNKGVGMAHGGKTSLGQQWGSIG